MSGMVIIGGGMAGARAIVNLRANDYAGPITLLSEEQHLPYDRPPLSKAAITDEAEPRPVELLDQGIIASLKAHVRLNAAVASIDRAAKQVVLGDGAKISYTKLLLATGAKPRALSLPGGEHAILLRNFEDAVNLRQRFVSGAKVVVIGGGFIGLELASSASARGCSVTLVEAQPRILMRGVPEAIAAIVHARHVAAGVVMKVGVGLSHLTATSVHLQNGQVIAANSIVAGIGAAPAISLAAAAGLTIDNGIACDQHLATSDPDIFASGDCCSFPHPRYGGRRIRLEAWRSAQEQAGTVAQNMLGGSKVHDAIPWFWSDQYELSLQVSGMPDMGPRVIERRTSENQTVLFHLAEDGNLMGASGIGPGNSIGRDVKLAEMMMAKAIKPSAAALADPAVQLKSLIKG